MHQIPTVGRIVHFNTVVTVDGVDSLVQQAALVVEVHTDTCVSIVTWNGYGTQNAHRSVSMGTSAGEWMWPART